MLNSVGKNEMICRAVGGGRRMESTPWITPLVPNCDMLEGDGDGDKVTYDVDRDDLAVEVDVESFEETESNAETLWLTAETVFAQGCGDGV